jgi:hypothetical protein
MKKLNLLVLAALVCVSSFAFAQEGGMSEDAMMKAWIDAGTPGPQHAALAKHVGEWDCVVKMWMDPKQPPMESKGTETVEMMFGGRIQVGHFLGDFMGTPFHGQSMTGYSNFAKVYWSTWIDDMSTALMYSEGTASEDGKTITMMGTMDEPSMNVHDKPVKQIMKLIDDDHFVFESWDEVGTPNEFKAMEISYTRKK